MRSLLSISALLSVAVGLPAFPPAGVATWVYDAEGGAPAEWAESLAAFNARSESKINVVFSYGGDMELYPALPQPYQTYFPAANQKAAAMYNATSGIDYVILVIDGVMSGGRSWSPDLSKLNDTQLRDWADEVASLYCSYDIVDGIQMDLEPFAGVYKRPFLVFLAALAANLRSPERGCVNADHPAGRAITTFLFAESVTDDVWLALGENGFLTISGYDLSSAPAGVPSTVAFFRAQLATALTAVAASAARNNGSFFVGVPAAASAHEFERFTLANGTVIDGYSQLDYITAALEELAAGAAGKAGYLGPALWAFSPQMEYPPHSSNFFTPGTPFVHPGEESFLATHL